MDPLLKHLHIQEFSTLTAKVSVINFYQTLTS